MAMSATRCSGLAALLGLLYACTSVLGAGRKLRGDGSDFMSNCMDDWKQTLALQNAFRASHQAPPLKWNVDLANAAQWEAETLVANKCVLKHAGYSVSDLLFANYGYKAKGNCVQATQAWYDEASDYKYTSTPWSSNSLEKIGHFSQLVWIGTRFVGCGSASNGKCVVVVCQYMAFGNEMSNSAFFSNVKPAKGKVDVSAVLGTPPPRHPK